jgi:hypothetical protein
MTPAQAGRQASVCQAVAGDANRAVRELHPEKRIWRYIASRTPRDQANLAHFAGAPTAYSALKPRR